ncbi:TPA: glycosyltransferase family 4 protein [Proteus mirabilis]|nr:glycosyltransferase family 4 protein [Proteus mirabilis]HEK2723703.1 glycosyltransferase family 4 protein [Proteus mirabilis]
MNIIFICNEYPPEKSGGIGIFTKELAESLVNKGHSIFVVGIYKQKKTTSEIINGVKVTRLPSNRFFKIIIDRYKLYLFLKNLVKKEKIQIIEYPDFQGILAFTPNINCKKLVRLHGSITYFYTLLGIASYKKTIWKLIEKNNLKKANKIISVSNFTALKTKEIYDIEQSIQTIYNGIKLDNPYIQKYPQDNIKKYIFAGSLIDKKGIKELVNAWKIFSLDKDDVELHIFGKDIEGLLSIFLADSQLKINKNIFFHGAVSKDKLVNFYNNCHFFISPSKAEAFSLAPMEAMERSLLVIYNNQTSAEELISDKINGFLIHNYDIVSALEKSYKLKNDEYNLITQKAYLTIKNKFNLKELLEKNIKIYKNLINS